MKKISLILVALAITASTAGCSQKNNTENTSAEEPAPSEMLMTRLHALADSGLTAFGHHDDTAYGISWAYAADSSDVKAVTGDYPAIINWDLGLVEVDSARQLDGVPFDFMRAEIAKHHARGGINSISWHPLNPLTAGNSWDVSTGATLTRIMADSAMVDTLAAWAGRAADFVASLRDADGRRIPVMFRPWHEHTGTWFWWGINSGTPEEYVKLWEITRKAFDDRGLDNVVWVYSPDKSNVDTYDDYMSRYPGDEYVDVMGADVYHFGNEEEFDRWIDATLGSAVRAAREHGKIAALSETGCEGLKVDNWYMQSLLPALERWPVAFVTVWRNSPTKPGHFYVPYPGHPGEQDFRDFHAQPRIAFCSDLNENN